MDSRNSRRRWLSSSSPAAPAMVFAATAAPLVVIVVVSLSWQWRLRLRQARIRRRPLRRAPHHRRLAEHGVLNPFGLASAKHSIGDSAAASSMFLSFILTCWCGAARSLHHNSPHLRTACAICTHHARVSDSQLSAGVYMHARHAARVRFAAGRGHHRQTDEQRRNPALTKFAYFGPYSTSRKIRKKRTYLH